MEPIAPREAIYRCAGPNCGQLKGDSSRWWLMWTSRDAGVSVLNLCQWDQEIAQKEACLHVCGEGCAQKLQSMFMANIRQHQDTEGRALGATGSL